MNLVEWVERYRRRMVKALGGEPTAAGDSPGVSVHVHARGRGTRTEKNMVTITKRLRSYARRELGVGADASDKTIREAVGRALKTDLLTADELGSLTDRGGGSRVLKTSKPIKTRGAGFYRVRNASERFSTKRYVGKHVKTGEPVIIAGKPVELPSELGYAKSAAWLRMIARKAGIHIPVTDAERGLIAELWEGKEEFTYAPDDNLTQVVRGQKAQDLFSDTTSGGAYLSPFFFDSDISLVPLLFSEIAPYVTHVPVSHGSEVDSALIQPVTAVWQASEQSAVMTPFDATSLIGRIVETMRPLSVAVKWGADLGADALVPVGETLMQLCGQRMAEELDDKICNGTNTTQLAGILNTSGATTINSDNSTGGPPTVGDYESLFFNVAKQYRNQNMNLSFIGNDTSYRRARGIPVGPGDERRVLGMAEADYRILDTPFRVQNNIANNAVACLPLQKFKLWKRDGVMATVTNEGAVLRLANEWLMVVRARYCGRVTDPASLVICSDMQS